MKLMRKAFFSSFLTLVLLFGACGNKVYDRFCHTPLEGWEKNDTLSFAVPKIANTGLYGIDLSLITSASYPFQGLTLIVEQHILPSKRTEIDTLSSSIKTAGRKVGVSAVINTNFTSTTIICLLETAFSSP